MIVIIGIKIHEHDDGDDAGADTATENTYLLHDSGSRSNFLYKVERLMQPRLAPSVHGQCHRGADAAVVGPIG